MEVINGYKTYILSFLVILQALADYLGMDITPEVSSASFTLIVGALYIANRRWGTSKPAGRLPVIGGPR